MTDAVEKAIVIDGVEEFIVGHYGGFDSMATATVIKAKKSILTFVFISFSPIIPLREKLIFWTDLTDHYIRMEWKPFPARLRLSGQIGMQ